MTDTNIFIHEILNKLNVIYGIGQLLKAESEYAPILLKAVEDSKQIIQQYRKNKNTTVNKQSCNLYEIIIESAKEQINSNEYPARILIKLSKQLTVISDQYMLKTIVSNLINNALKYNKNKNDIKIIGTTNGTTKLSIIDNGVGMSKDEISNIGKLYNRFNRIQRKGSGVGMYIIMNWCKRLNHLIKIESTLNIGTTITIEFNG